MADVFASYSRTDREFVRRLADALTRSGKDVWIDWEDIPPASEWRSEIAAGIDGADAFVYVISPDAVTSRDAGGLAGPRGGVPYARGVATRTVP